MQRTPSLGMPAAPAPYGGSTRRDFLRGAFWLSGGAASAGVIAGLTRYFDARAVPFLVDSSQVPLPGAEPQLFSAGRFYLVNLRPGEGGLSTLSRPIEGSESGGLLALSLRCPYNDRPSVRWHSDFAFAWFNSHAPTFLAAETHGDGWFRCPICDSTSSRAGLVFTHSWASLVPLPITFGAHGSLAVGASSRF